MKVFSGALISGLLLVLAPVHSHAAVSFGGIVEGGMVFHSGDSTKSLTGANSYVLGLGAQVRQGYFRPQVSVLLQFASGKASIGTDTPDFTMYGGTILPGLTINPFGGMKSGFQPFLSGFGVIGSHYFQMSTPPTGIDKNTLGLSFGYEVGAGVDIAMANKKALRIQTVFMSVSSAIAGQSGFLLNGFRFTLGYFF
jgi:hypothetical protein